MVSDMSEREKESDKQKFKKEKCLINVNVIE